MQNRIRELRRAHGMTLKQLGETLGLAESTISHYETGKRGPDNETLLKLGELFGVTVGYILGVETKENTLISNEEREVNDSDLMFALWGDNKDVDESDLADVKRYAAFVRERKREQKK